LGKLDIKVISLIALTLIAASAVISFYYESRRSGVTSTEQATTPRSASSTNTTSAGASTVGTTTAPTTTTHTATSTTPSKPSLSDYLKSKIGEVLAACPELDPGGVGIYISTLNGTVLYAYSPHNLLIPASNMKLLTATTALRYLGPDYEFETTLLVDGEVSNGTLRGNLIVRGRGDPTLVSGDWASEWAKGVGSLYESEHVLDEVLEILAGLGVKRVDGDIIVDDYYLDHEWVHPSWGKDDLSYYYAAQVGALAINRNTVLLKIYVDSSGKVKIEAIPDVNYVEVFFGGRVVKSSSEVKQKPTAVRTLGTNEITVVGDVVAGSDPYYLTVTVHDPGMYFGAVLKGVLQKHGVEVLGSVRRANTTEWSGAKPVGSLRSRPLAVIIRDMLKSSINLYAEQVMKVLGKEVAGEGSWGGGSKAIEKMLSELGISEPGIVIADGSGLSRWNRLTPYLLVKLLAAFYGNKYLYDSLPIAGVDGTLRSRMQGTPAQGNLRAKTGTLTGVSALSGYVTTRDNVVLVFSMIFNGFTVSSGTIKNKAEDRIGSLLADLDTSSYTFKTWA